MNKQKNYLRKKPLRIVLLVAACLLLWFVGSQKEKLFTRLSLEPGAPIEEMHAITAHEGTTTTLACPICRLKAVFTILFLVAYILLTLLIVFLAFHQTKWLLVTAGIYLFLLLVCALLLIVGFFAKDFNHIYLLINRVIGLLQSPVIVMILIPAAFLSEKKKHQL